MEAESITVDEIIIQCVQENKCLYDKTDKNFKDNKKKKDVWFTISENLRNLFNIDMPADAVEKRWSSLRDMFSRENRRQKQLPSGSGYEPVKEWCLYKNMQFLIPHVAHRRTKTSLPSVKNNILLGISTTGENCLSSSTSSPSNINHNCIQKTKSVEDIILDIRGITNVDLTNDMIDRPASTLSNCSSSNLQFSAPSTSSDSTLNSPVIFKPIEKIVPELDHFAKRRKYKNEQLEQELEKTTSSISTALKSVENIMFNKKGNNTDGYMMAIEEGIKHVPAKNKTQCLIEILQIIQKYEERQ